MSELERVGKRFAVITAVRGVLMLLAGFFAIASPHAALTTLMVVGGALLVVDGVLGLWSLTFGGGKSGNYWFDIYANALSLILGAIILISPFMATVFTVTVLTVLIGLISLLVGGMQIYVVVRERDSYARIWPVVLSGVCYVLLGLVLLFFPMLTASVAVITGGVILVFLGVGLLGWAWRLYQGSKVFQ